MEESHFVFMDISNNVKEEFIPEEENVSDQRILDKEFMPKSDTFLVKDEMKTEGFSEESYVQLPIKEELVIKNEDVMDEEPHTFLVKNKMKTEGFSEESDVQSVIKEEPSIRNEDVMDKENTSSHMNADKSEDVIQQDVCCTVNGVIKQRVGFRKLKRYQCDKVFAQNCDYVCDVCGRAVAHMSSLKRHKKFVHKEFNCEVCNKAFTSTKYLTEHLKVHTIEKNKYKCAVCNKGFISAKYLTNHLKAHYF